MNEEPDMFGSTELTDSDFEFAKLDLEKLTEEEFEGRYKATKRLYKALINSFPILHEVHQALQDPNPLEIDPDVTDAVRYLIDDLSVLMDQMHMASYWEKEGA
jgi:hypothetical protein